MQLKKSRVAVKTVRIVMTLLCVSAMIYNWQWLIRISHTVRAKSMSEKIDRPRESVSVAPFLEP